MIPREAASARSPSEDAAARVVSIRRTATEELDGLYRFAVAQLGSRSQAAPDVVQEALSIALAHAHPPDTASAQRSWLRGIVRNVIRHHSRSVRREKDKIERASMSMKQVDSNPDRSSVDERRQRVQALFVLVTQLDTADQDLFYAFYRAGQSHASLAAEWGTTIKAIEARLYRLRARLRAMDPLLGSRA